MLTVIVKCFIDFCNASDLKSVCSLRTHFEFLAPLSMAGIRPQKAIEVGNGVCDTACCGHGWGDWVAGSLGGWLVAQCG